MHKSILSKIILSLFLISQIGLQANCDCTTRSWVDAEYLLWQIKEAPEPVPLAFSAPTTGSLIPFPILGDPGTEVVLGGHNFQPPIRSGGRFTVGVWFDDEHELGTEISYLFLANGSKSQSVASSGLPGSQFLLIPFFNVETLAEDSTGLAIPLGLIPGLAFAGSAVAKVSNYMQGAEWNVLNTYSCCEGFDLKLLLGFRYWNFNETFTFKTSQPNVVAPLDTWLTEDKFKTNNQFYGGQLGLQFDYQCDCVFLNVRGKVALGGMCQTLTIDGILVTNDFSGFGSTFETFDSGYFAQSTNSGHHNHTSFSVIPEIDVKLGYQITPQWSVQVGYTFMYASNVMRASNQLDSNINPSQAPAINAIPSTVLVGTPAPLVLNKTSSFWAQGLDVGVSFDF